MEQAEEFKFSKADFKRIGLKCNFCGKSKLVYKGWKNVDRYDIAVSVKCPGCKGKVKVKGAMMMRIKKSMVIQSRLPSKR